MSICLDFVENCEQPTGFLISFTVIYYAFVTAVILTQLITTRYLLKRLPNNDELLVLKALTFASFQVICFNIAGLWEARDNVHIMFRVIILVFQLLSILLLNVLMIIAFYEIKRNRKYEEVERDDEDDFYRVDLNEFDFLKTKFAFIVFGMIYSAVIVIGLALICELYANDSSVGFNSVNFKSYKVTEHFSEG
ncbi:hypothetical protein PVAND_016807 [Polypedilum vanderplanki]|uniref:Uncharacterized protein n=1 Tax=Polypedilum vanderplanki TaxID=319348 RepID=A0A9J6BH29_POLVA|nr:hypothetical protein PVAND_016807 [Polypedilum vanderplanki]